MTRVRLDFGNVMAPALSEGVDESLFLGGLSEAFTEAHTAVEARRSQGDLGFLDLPHASEMHSLDLFITAVKPALQS